MTFVLWLALAFALSLFALNGSWDISLAAWLYPVFLLRFARTHRPTLGFLGACLVNAGAACVWYFQIGLGLQVLILAGVVVVVIFMSLPYLIDRLISPRFAGFVSMLIFPLSFVAVDYLKTLLYPYGSVGSLAYTQYGNLPLLQLIAITGISGIVFLITWFASVVNYAWERHFAWPRIRTGVLLYSVLLGLVLSGGGARLALFPPQAQTVRVAGISISQTVETQAMKQIATAFPAFLAGKATHADLMLVPSNDWRQIDPWHSQDITFRAIENGFSLVRQTSNGLVIAVDYEGRVLASSDYFATGDQVMIVLVPAKGTQTIYTLVGDLFAQLCMAGLLLLIVFVLVQSRRQHTIRKPLEDKISPSPA